MSRSSRHLSRQAITQSVIRAGKTAGWLDESLPNASGLVLESIPRSKPQARGDAGVLDVMPGPLLST